MPKTRRHHSTRTRYPRAHWYAVPRPLDSTAPMDVAGAIMEAAALATAAGARVLIAAVAPAPRLVLAAPAAGTPAAGNPAVERAQEALAMLDAEISYAPDDITRARLEIDRLDLVAVVHALRQTTPIAREVRP